MSEPYRPKILVVLTSQDKLGDTGRPTGWYLPEFAHPHDVLAPHCKIVVASPAGGEAPIDPNSVEQSKSDRSAVEFLEKKQVLYKHTEKLSDMLGKAKDFEAIFYVGGHGPMFDIASNPISHQLINEFWSAGKILAAVCHGPAAFVFVRAPDGKPLLANSEVTGFSNEEENSVKLLDEMPFSLEDELNKASGGHYVKAPKPWGAKVVIAQSGRLITGQNPASAEGVGQAIVELVKV